MNKNTSKAPIVAREEVGKRLAEARTRKGLTQKQACEDLGIVQGLLSMWESGKVPEGAVDVTRAGWILGLTPDRLYLETATSKLDEQARKDLVDTEAKRFSELLKVLVELSGMAGPGIVKIFLDHARNLKKDFALQIHGRATVPLESGARLPSREEVRRLKADLLAFATSDLAERPEAKHAVSVARRLNRLIAVLPQPKDAAGTAAPQDPGRSPQGPEEASSAPHVDSESPSSPPRKKKR